jgi:pimeloyl-ACP methyl ester carboxylesterase
MDDLGLVEAPLVGHSLGAVAALLFAARMPDRVSKLMLVSLPLQGAAINRKLYTGSDNVLDRTIGRRQAQQAYPEVAQEADKADNNAVVFSTRALANLDLTSEIEKINRPLLIVHGEKDLLIIPPSLEAISDMEDTARQISLKDSLHFPMLDEAAKFQRLLRDFLEGGLDSLELRDEWKRRQR